jgi:hypothetical protein
MDRRRQPDSDAAIFGEYRDVGSVPKTRLGRDIDARTRGDYQCLFFEWAATNYPGITYTEANGVRHMLDFVSAHADTFNPRWTLERARVEEQKWHAELAVAQVVDRTGVPLDTVIDYAPLPLLWEDGDLSFVALQTGKALRAEGAAMHHCVASYWQNVVKGRSRIYSTRENGRRVATLEVTDRLTQYIMGLTPLRGAPGNTAAIRWASWSGHATRARHLK